MRISHIVSSLLLMTVVMSCSTIEKLQKKPIGLINRVTYLDSSYNNLNASNGFLATYENQTYAITAKHVLMIAKTDQMEFVDFENSLKEWRMHPKNDDSEYIILDKLLNPNRKDSLTWDYMYTNWDTYNDWLIFSIKENNSKHKPLNFRSSKLQKGENLFVIGWSYSDSLGAQRIYEYTFDETEGNYHYLKQKNGPASLGGLSGSPIVDEKGQLVGLVTSGWEDENTKEVFLEATTTKNMLEFIKEMQNKNDKRQVREAVPRQTM